MVSYDVMKLEIKKLKDTVNLEADKSQDREHSVNGVIGSLVQPREGQTAGQKESHKKAGS